MADVCKGCDGRKYNEREDRDNCMKSKRVPCGRCNATGTEPGPPKGKGNGRFFRKKDPDEDPTIEEQTQAFLRQNSHRSK